MLHRGGRRAALALLLMLAAPAGAQPASFNPDAFLGAFYKAVAAQQSLQPYFVATPEFGLNASKVVLPAQTLSLLLNEKSVYVEGERTRFEITVRDIQVVPRGAGYALAYRERWAYGDSKSRTRRYHEERTVQASVVPAPDGWAMDAYAAENVADTDVAPVLVATPTIEITGRGFGSGVQSREKLSAGAPAAYFLIGMDRLAGGHWLTVTSEPSGVSVSRRFFLWADGETSEGRRISRAPQRGAETAAVRGGIAVFLWGALVKPLKPAEYKITIEIDGRPLGVGKLTIIK